MRTQHHTHACNMAINTALAPAEQCIAGPAGAGTAESSNGPPPACWTIFGCNTGFGPEELAGALIGTAYRLASSMATAQSPHPAS